MRVLGRFLRLIDARTITVAVFSLVSTYLCRVYGITADMPSGLIGAAIVFPIVFSINASYRRREEALQYFSSFKGNAMGIFFAHRDWGVRGSDEDSERAQHTLEGLVRSMREFFSGAEAGSDEYLKQIMGHFSALSRSHEVLREHGVAATEISRANQFLAGMITDFEKMRTILQYRTPISLRSYSRVFLNAFPVLFGPYFAYLGGGSAPFVGYAVACLYSLVLVSLDNIQEDLENPFDGIGEDDMTFAVSDFVKEMEAAD